MIFFGEGSLRKGIHEFVALSVKIFSRYQGASRNGCLKALRGAGFL